MLNINYGHNKELMNKCIALRDYSILNKRVRDNLDKGMPIEAAADHAIDSCIRDGIMADFLIKEKAGVIKMHVLDYDEEKHSRSLIEEGISQGIEQGVNDSVIKLAEYLRNTDPALTEADAVKQASAILK